MLGLREKFIGSQDLDPGLLIGNPTPDLDQEARELSPPSTIQDDRPRAGRVGTAPIESRRRQFDRDDVNSIETAPIVPAPSRFNRREDRAFWRDANRIETAPIVSARSRFNRREDRAFRRDAK